MTTIAISPDTREQLEDLLTRLANGVLPTDIGAQLRQQRDAAEILRHIRAATPAKGTRR